jgi:hypothetical protein
VFYGDGEESVSGDGVSANSSVPARQHTSILVLGPATRCHCEGQAKYESDPTLILKTSDEFAEKKGFEPLVELPPRRFSKPLPSTTRPLLQNYDFAAIF